MTAVLALAATAAAQGSTHLNLEEALERASSALMGNTFAFTYSLWTAQYGESPIQGEGEADLARHHWCYSVHTPEGVVAWIILDTTWYHNVGVGWQTDGLDFTYAGIAAIIQPFASYAQIKTLASGESDRLIEVHYLGDAVVDDMHAQGYAFGTRGLPMFGSADHEMWLSEGPTGYERIILKVTPASGNVNTVTFTHIGEPVEIEAPL